MRLIPKFIFADRVFKCGLLSALLSCAADESSPAAPAAQGLIAAIFDAYYQNIDLDFPDYVNGADALVYYEIVSQAQRDMIEEVYVAWSFKEYIEASNSIVFCTADGREQSITLCRSVSQSELETLKTVLLETL
jgi:hypothetical protein